MSYVAAVVCGDHHHIIGWRAGWRDYVTRPDGTLVDVGARAV